MWPPCEKVPRSLYILTTFHPLAFKENGAIYIIGRFNINLFIVIFPMFWKDFAVGSLLFLQWHKKAHLRVVLTISISWFVSSGLATGVSKHVQDPFKVPHSPESSQNHATKKLHKLFQLNTRKFSTMGSKSYVKRAAVLNNRRTFSWDDGQIFLWYIC
jgi:hypothetical protein